MFDCVYKTADFSLLDINSVCSEKFQNNFLHLGLFVSIGGLAVVAFWRSPHGPLGSGPPRAAYSQRRKRKEKGEKGLFNIFATAGLRTQSAPVCQNIAVIYKDV